jgi:hypothetical protein
MENDCLAYRIRLPGCYLEVAGKPVIVPIPHDEDGVIDMEGCIRAAILHSIGELPPTQLVQIIVVFSNGGVDMVNSIIKEWTAVEDVAEELVDELEDINEELDMCDMYYVRSFTVTVVRKVDV